MDCIGGYECGRVLGKLSLISKNKRINKEEEKKKEELQWKRRMRKGVEVLVLHNRGREINERNIGALIELF